MEKSVEILRKGRCMRKVAANYLLFPGWELTKNGYVEFLSSGEMRVVDTGGKIRDLAGLEFYGGMLVPDYVRDYVHLFHPGDELLPLLRRILAERGKQFERIALIEGADLMRLVWTEKSVIRLF